jgi:DNA polymerase III subunit delta
MEIQSLKDFQNLVKKDSLSGLVVIYGDEKATIKESISIIYGTITSFPEMNIVTIEGDNITFDRILNACETVPFLSEQKIVHVKNPNFLVNATDSNNKDTIEKLSSYAKNISHNTVLLLSSNEEVDEKNNLLKVAKGAGVLVRYRMLKGDALQKWILDTFNKRGKEINKSDIFYIISEVGTQTDTLSMEIDKICFFALEEDVITRNHIDEVVHKSLESNIFKMVDSIGKKDAEKSMTILNTLLFQKEDYTRIIGMIIRQFRLLYLIKLQQNVGKTSDEIGRSLKLNEYVLQNLIKQSRNYNEHNLGKSMNICLETDYKIKSGKLTPEMALELLVVELCK